MMKTFKELYDNNKLTSIQVRGRYDGTAYWMDKEGNRYSRNGNPIELDELSRPGQICKVEAIGEYDYKVLSIREDVLVS